MNHKPPVSCRYEYEQFIGGLWYKGMTMRDYKK